MCSTQWRLESLKFGTDDVHTILILFLKTNPVNKQNQLPPALQNELVDEIRNPNDAKTPGAFLNSVNE